MLTGSANNTHTFDAMYRALMLDQSVFLPVTLRR
jgi:hypothetical protein